MRPHRGAVAALLLVGCSGPLDGASGYEDQEFLCDPDRFALREARKATCRSDAGCVGYVSFRGTLQKEPVTVGAALSSVELDWVRVAEIGLVRDAIKLNAESPYFTLRWVFSDFPPLQTAEAEVEYPIRVADQADSVNASLRLQGGGASAEFAGRAGVLRTDWTPSEQSGEADVDFGAGNELIGCFFARVAVEPPQ